MAMLHIAVLAVFATAVLLTPTHAQWKDAQKRDDSATSYSSYQPAEAPHHSYAPQPQQYAPQPQQYMVYPAAPPPSYEEEEEEEEPAAAAAAEKPKEDKKCAVKLVLPPLIIITIFIGLILLHLVVPTLMPAFVNPFVLPLVAVVNALTGAAGPGLPVFPGLAALLAGLGLPPPGGLVINVPPKLKEGEGRQNEHFQGPFESLLHLTAAVTAAVDDEKCLARLLCQAGTTLPKETSWSKSLRYLLPKEYHPYITLMEKARSGGPKGCARDYSCPQLEEIWQ